MTEPTPIFKYQRAHDSLKTAVRLAHRKGLETQSYSALVYLPSHAWYMIKLAEKFEKAGLTRHTLK